MAIDNAARSLASIALTAGALDTYNVKSYGAIGNNVADDSNAIIAACSACYTGGGGVIYFPKGKYRVTQNNVLAPFTTPSSGQSITYRGAGMLSSMIVLDSTAAVAPMWALQANRSVTTLFAVSFYDLGIAGFTPGAGVIPAWSNTLTPTYSNGIQIYADSTSVFNCNISFSRVGIYGMQSCFDFEGVNLASEISHIGCYYQSTGSSPLYIINNQQSDDHFFHGCQIASFDDVIKIGSGSSGNVSMYGCDIAMYGQTGTKNTYFLNASTGATLQPINIHGARFEITGNYVNMATINLGFYMFTLDTCYVLDHVTTSKPTWLYASSYGHVRMVNTHIELPGGGTITLTKDGSIGSFMLDSCWLPTSFASHAVTTNSGVITAINNIEGNGPIIPTGLT